MSATSERDFVCVLAKTNTPKAHEIAEQISDPWFRCQALAWVARFAPEAQFNVIAQESISACRLMADDPYQVVGAAAWPLRAMIERDRGDQVHRLLPRFIKCAVSITNPVTRLDALFLLWQAVFPLGSELSDWVLEPLVTACRTADSWKGIDTLCQIVLILTLNFPKEAEQLVICMPNGRHKRQAMRLLIAEQHKFPRTFFW